MNTATQALPFGSFKAGSQSRPRTKSQQKQLQASQTKIYIFVSLLILLLASAFSVIYFKDLNRRLFIQYQDLLKAQQQAKIETGKLLLEQSTWASQGRVQHIANNRLGMVIPNREEIAMVADLDSKHR